MEYLEFYFFIFFSVFFPKVFPQEIYLLIRLYFNFKISINSNLAIDYINTNYCF